jgi:CHAT domain-containing protein
VIQKVIFLDEPRWEMMTRSGLGNVYRYWGKFSEAESLLTESLIIDEKTGQQPNQNLPLSLTNLANVKADLHKDAEAETLMHRALRIIDTLGATNVQRRANILDNLGSLQERRNNASAESLYLQGYHLRQQALPREHPDITWSRIRLATLFRDHSKPGESERLFREALEQRESTLPPDHPWVADALEGLSTVQRLKGETLVAFQTMLKAVTSFVNIFRGRYAAVSELDALKLSLSFKESVNNLVSTFLDAKIDDDSTRYRISDILLYSKGQVSDNVIEQRQAIVRERDSSTQALASGYLNVKLKLARLYVSGPQREAPEVYKQQLDSLSALVKNLESELTHRSVSFRNLTDRQNISTTRLASLLPPNCSLVEYVRYDYVTYSPLKHQPRYLAIVLDANATPKITNLANGNMIDSLVRVCRSHFLGVASTRGLADRRLEDAYKIISRQLQYLIWEPIASSIKRGATLFIAPDGALNLVSFASLIGPDGKYLIEKHPVHYLSAGRDLIRVQEQTSSGTGLIAFGDPDYDASVERRLKAEEAIALNQTVKEDPYALRNIRSGCGELSEMKVPPLFNTRSEVQTVAGFWKNSHQNEPFIVYLGSNASEEHFKKEAVGKRVIHLATQGYFLEGECTPRVETGQRPFSTDTFIGENPLLLSGLLLAGANLHGKGAEEAQAEDGIVTALEVSAMGLRGTDLVVLSACETGLGKVEQGEGVYGLRRAFQMAGARTVVSALWQVPDEETMKFMKELYGQKASTYPELMQKVALKRINELRLRKRPTHPFSWGGFVATGDWRIKR